MGEVTRSACRIRGFEHGEFDFQLLRTMGISSYGGATVGECLAATLTIEEPDPESWVVSWEQLADNTLRVARECFDRGHHVSARDQLMRASNYYRTAEYYAPIASPKQRDLGLAAREVFGQALPLLPLEAEVIEIPFETPLCGYFIQPAGDPAPRKTIVTFSGYDGTSEELYFMNGLAGVERGYNVLLFDGPGQTGLRRLHPDTAFRHDYEVPIRAVIDWTLARPEVDADRLALYGISFGGHLCARAACFEKRIKALVANSPIVDWATYLGSWTKPEEGEDEDIRVAEVPEVPDDILPPHEKWALLSLCKKYGAETYFEALEKLNAYRVEEHLGAIDVPCLAMIGEGEGEEALRQADLFCDRVSGDVSKRLFTVAEGADAHCQQNNVALACQVLYDWLDELFA
ncbi:2,6-dihydropseudooxynicotine hydrolase [Planctomycetes bacterium Pan216]|uniref:2,6-dihydropseudooxynicotine hydrolase n=1 Tax=Kolteria novifilia TaxID=2527975 RepID=A0A518BBH1_9BACT|nr:2,6-dihydropseudooxynicotine hydrolase [Planctomycetes bacterium Pan216]